MKKIWDEIGVFPVTEQRLADQAREIRVNKWLTDTEIEEIDRSVETLFIKKKLVIVLTMKEVEKKNKVHKEVVLTDNM